MSTTTIDDNAEEVIGEYVPSEPGTILATAVIGKDGAFEIYVTRIIAWFCERGIGAYKNYANPVYVDCSGLWDHFTNLDKTAGPIAEDSIIVFNDGTTIPRDGVPTYPLWTFDKWKAEIEIELRRQIK